MIITDTFSNLFSAIQNGFLSNKSKITQLKSKKNIYLLNLFVYQGFIKSYKISLKNQYKLEIFLKYNNNQPILRKIQRLSKPGKRLYIKHQEFFQKKKGFYIVSTSKGFLTEIEAKKLNLGGELICKIF